MTELDRITVVVVNYRTLALTRTCVEGFVARYPNVSLILIDNGSGDESTEYIRKVGETLPSVKALLNPRNLYHGPALDQGVRFAETPYVFTLDSDCEIRQGGFLEKMLPYFENPSTYAVGELRYKNRFGFTYGYGEAAQPQKAGRIPYIHPYAMLLDRNKYLGLHRFIHHGAPCIRNMEDAKRAGHTVFHFQISDFVLHRMQGTSASHGYGFRAAARQRIDFYLNRLNSFVKRDPTLPVQPRSGGED
jgi:glycosyltransferase involved in cell wall biosynthesis